MRKDVLVLIPAYNEESNIRKVLEQLKARQITGIADILIVDDASSDFTGRLAAEAGICTVITNVTRLGYGGSIQAGYRYALCNDYRYVIQMDADGQHDACNIPIILQRLKSREPDGRYPDIVLASRFMEGSSAFNVSIFKKIAYAWFRFLIRIITGRRIPDPTTGLQGLNRRAFRYYSGEHHFDPRYPDANMVIQMLLLGFNVVAIPAVMHARTDGQSMHKGWRAVWYMCWMFVDIPAIVLRIKLHKLDPAEDLEDVEDVQEENKISGRGLPGRR